MRYLFIITLGLITFNSCDSNSSSNNSNSSSSYQSSKMTVEETERSNPLKFIRMSKSASENLIGQWVFEVTIFNDATSITYKDFVFEVTYFSKTNSELKIEESTIYEYVKPNSYKKFKVKLNGHSKAKSYDATITSAIAAN